METSSPRATPLTLVSGAIAGDDLDRVTTTVATALDRPIAVAIPALGAPVVRPAGALSPAQTDAIHLHATACVAGVHVPAPEGVEESAAIQIGEEVVGIVVAAPAGNGPSEMVGPAELRAWLEAAAAAASINALIREAQGGARADDGAALLLELTAGAPEDVAGFLARARRAGFELGAGATALAAHLLDPDAASAPERHGVSDLISAPGALATMPGPGRLLVLVPAGAEPGAEAIAAGLREAGLEVAASAPRRDPAGLHEAVREVQLLLALADAGVPVGGQDETYRLLIGVLLRDPDELEQLRDRTISALTEYDARHDTDLLATLHAFLAHDGSTTETAEAMTLHRHTVGYRLSRVHEVSTLSPYESDGRERLSLGLKAHQILEADARTRPGS